MERKEQLTRVFARSIRDILERAQVDFEQVQEIRLRVRGPLLMVSGGREYYLTGEGRLSGEMEQAHVVSREEIRETMEYISSHSLYAFEEEVRQGFLTIQGGHRVGIAGKTILDDGGIRSMKYISFINIRLSHQIRGCADPVMPYLYENGQVLHTLIISPPRCGKTTLLRDIVRQLSNGSCRQPGVTVGVVDERSEIGACCQWVPQNELGIRTDVLDRKGIEYQEVDNLDEAMPKLDILYMTRVQKERFFNEEDYIRLKDSYILDNKKMQLAKKDMYILHPLPRVNEISVEVDKDPRAAYFRQAQYGVYVRMALIMTLLEVAKPC